MMDLFPSSLAGGAFRLTVEFGIKCLLLKAALGCFFH